MVNNAGTLEVGTKFTDIDINRNLNAVTLGAQSVIALSTIFLKYFKDLRELLSDDYYINPDNRTNLKKSKNHKNTWKLVK